MARTGHIASLVLVVGCAYPYHAPSLGEESSSSTSTSTSTSTSDEIDPPERIGGPFLQEPDGGNDYGRECDTFSQDCPTGEKCTVWANDGGGSWSSTKCEPIAPDPDRAGESCTVVGNGLSGIDSCAHGSMCLVVEWDSNEGVCREFCGGSEANPTCSDPLEHCVGRYPMLCMPGCCPLEQSCGDGQACYPLVDTFMCAPDVSGDEAGAFGDDCAFINVCDAGLFCANADRVPACVGEYGCCTAFCEVGSSTCEALHPDLECIAWFEEGQNPLESHVGGCMLPEEE